MTSSVSDPRRVVRRLYGRASGFEIADRDCRAVERMGGSATYGELTPTGTQRLLEFLALGPAHRFYDLGSGLGKVVLQAAIASDCDALFGYELVAGRHATACDRLEAAERDALVDAGRVEFCRADFMQADLRGATHVFAASTTWPDRLMRRLARKLASNRVGTVLVSLRDLDETPWWEPGEAVRVDTTWMRRVRAHSYVLRRRYGFSRRK